jgi:general secretion pathway protein M
MKQWLLNLNQREQLSLLALGAALIVYVLYMAVWLPVADGRDDMVVRNQHLALSLQRVDAMVSQLKVLRESGEGRTNKPNLTSVINQSTNRMNLKVSRLQPNSRGELQVRLENASFDDVLAWLYEMEYAQGLLVREVSLTGSGSAGRVNASVRLARAS